MKKILIMLGCFALSVAVFAGPHGGGRGCPPGGGGCRPTPRGPGGCRPCPPPRPHHPCGPGWGGCDRGLANACAITGIVANGLRIANELSYPSYNYGYGYGYAYPTVSAPVVYQTPVYTAPQVYYYSPYVYQPYYYRPVYSPFYYGYTPAYYYWY